MTAPEEGAPPPVRIEMKPRPARPKAAEAASGGPVGDAAADKIETDAYDVRDLLCSAPDFGPSPVGIWQPVPEKGAAPAAGGPADGPDDVSGAVDRLVATIQGEVGPGSWQPAGAGSIRYRAASLIVTQTAANQAAVVKVLERLRAARSVQVTCVPELFEVSANEDPELRVWIEKELGRRTAPDGAQMLLSDAEAAKFRERWGDHRLKPLPAMTPPGAPLRLTMMNGQRAHVAVGKAVEMKMSYASRPGRAVPGSFTEGWSVDIRPTASSDLKWITMTLRPRITRLLSQDAEPIFAVAESEVTANVPEGKTLMLRMRFVAKKATGARELEGPRNGPLTWDLVTVPADKQVEPQGFVYLLIKGAVIVQQELEAKDGPHVDAAGARVADDGAARKARVAELINQLGDADARIRNQAGNALGEMGEAALKAVPGLIKALGDDPDPKVRWRAAVALASIRPKEKTAAKAAVEALIKALGDPDAKVRASAAWSLGWISTGGQEGAV